MTTNYLTSYSRAVHRHAQALANFRAAKKAGLDFSYAEIWLSVVREWAGYARTYLARVKAQVKQ